MASPAATNTENVEREREEHESGSEEEEEEEEGQQQSTSGKKNKKKKKKSKAARMLSALKGNKDDIPDELVNQVLGEVRARGDEEAQNANAAEIRQALETMKIMDVVRGKAGIGGHNRKDMGEHKFWSTQPVPQLGEGPPIDDGYIEPPVPRDQVQQEGYTLPKDFEWSTIDISDPNQLKEVYDLLSLHYVEDHDASFRFQYTADFLRWALAPPGYFKEWHVGVRVKSNKKLVGFIAGVPLTIRVRKNVFVSCEINYLCVHKKLRSKRLAPMLIKEVTRRVHLEGIFQAIYTAGTVVPTPVSVCRYNHRPLNTSKLVSIRFSYVPRTTTLARMIRTNKLPDAFTLPVREMEERDVEGVADLFAQYMTRFDMIPHFNLEEVRHQFLSGRGTGDVVHGRREGQVTWTYVVEDPETHKITDFFSFYSLPSTVIGNTEYPVLEAAYLYYYASSASWEKSKEEYKQHINALMGDALIVADKARFDVFNALTLMDNVEFLSDLKFGKGDGYLNFYLYNWRTAALAGMEAIGDREAGRGVGVVML